MINKIFDKKYEKYTRKTYIESEIDKILKDYGDKNIYINYGDKGNKNKFDTENITKSLKKLRNKFINFNEFKEEYNKFINNVEELKNYKSKNNASFSKNQLKMKRYARDLKDIVDPYILKSDIDTSEKDSGTSEKDSDTSEKDTSEKGIDTSNKGEGLKILSNKQMLNRLPILLAQIEAGNNSKSLKNELRQILYSLYRSKVLTKTVYNNLIKSIHA